MVGCACAQAARVYETLELPLGRSVRTSDGVLTLTLVDVADSRCPTEATCIELGSAIVKIHVDATGRSQTVMLNTGGLKPVPNGQTVFGRLIQLTKLEPWPRTGSDADDKQYVATLTLSTER